METQTHAFSCKKCGNAFETGGQTLSRQTHMLLGLVTLGGWLVLYALYSLVWLHWRSRCPACGRRSRKLLLLNILVIGGTLELGLTLYYFMEIAPQQIIRDASYAELPENLDADTEITRDNIGEILSFITIVAVMPAAGSFIANQWPYILLVWFALVAVLGLWVPPLYRSSKAAGG